MRTRLSSSAGILGDRFPAPTGHLTRGGITTTANYLPLAAMQRPYFARLLRTASSERYALQNDAGDFGALDLHYLPDSTVQATLVLFEGAGILDEDIPELLHHIDEVLLPEVRLDQHNLTFTVVVGRVLGAFTAEQNAPAVL